MLLLKSNCARRQAARDGQRTAVARTDPCRGGTDCEQLLVRKRSSAALPAGAGSCECSCIMQGGVQQGGTPRRGGTTTENQDEAQGGGALPRFAQRAGIHARRGTDIENGCSQGCKEGQVWSLRRRVVRRKGLVERLRDRAPILLQGGPPWRLFQRAREPAGLRLGGGMERGALGCGAGQGKGRGRGSRRRGGDEVGGGHCCQEILVRWYHFPAVRRAGQVGVGGVGRGAGREGREREVEPGLVDWCGPRAREEGLGRG